MLHYKIIIGFGGFAFIISFLSCLLGGVPFGSLVLRVMFGTVLFSGLGAGIGWVFNRFLPELFEANQNSSGNATDEHTDEEVDIVLPEENPHENSKLKGTTDLSDGLEDVDAKTAEGVEETEGGKETATEIDSIYNEEEQPVKVEEPDNSAGPAESDKDFSGSGSIPDLDSMQEKFTNTGTDNTSGTNASVNISGEDQDPENVAKAIRTWLNKDEEG